MSITELIAAVGDENIELQDIQQNLDSAQTVRGNGKVTFVTAAGKVTDMFAGNESKFVGLVLWLPRERMPK